MEEKIADLHCHPSLKPTYNSKIPNIWKEEKNISTRRLFRNANWKDKLRKIAIDMFLKNMAKYTQSNLENCYKGNNKLVFFALYPPERPFMKPDRPFNKGTKTHKKILRAIFSNIGIDIKIIRALTGFSTTATEKFIDDIYQAETVDYFKDFMVEYKKITDKNGEPYSIPGYTLPAKLKLVNNYDELQSAAINEIAGIITLEGAHSLAEYNKDALFEAKDIYSLDPTEREKLEESFINNIKTVKELEFPPFFLTFSHHFNNLISGHAKSFKDAPNRTIPGFSNVFDQTLGLDEGLTDFGEKLIKDYLLSKEYGGRRILIDTKHMSLKTRTKYTEIALNYEPKIPIICSHTAVNGISTREESERREDTNCLDSRSYVSRWDINLTDEDITDIFDTDGIIGVCMHDGRMPGGKFNKLVKQENRAMGSTIRVKRLHEQMFLSNVFHIVKVNLKHIRDNNSKPNRPAIDERDAWKTVSLGTDFDGIIDPFDHWNTAGILYEFKARCKDAIQYNYGGLADRERAKSRVIHIKENSSRPYTRKEFEELTMDFTPQQLVDKIFYSNIEHFCSKYFTRAYLE